MKTLKELNKLKNFNLIRFAVPIIDYLCPIKYSPNQKYSNEYFFICLLEFVDGGVYPVREPCLRSNRFARCFAEQGEATD